MKINPTTWFYQRLFRALTHPIVKGLSERILPHRLWIILGAHLFLFTVSYAVSIRVLDEGLPQGEALFYRTLAPLVVLRLVAFWWHDLFQGLWRYVSFQDLLNIIRASFLSSIVFILVGFLWGPLRVPERLALLDLTFCIFFTGGIRFVVRNIRENFLQAHPVQSIKNILVVGPLNRVQPLVKDLMGDPDRHYIPYAVLDPTRHDRIFRSRINDVPVLTPPQLLEQRPTLRSLEAIVICWPEAGKKQLEKVVEDLKSLQVPFKIIPQVEDILTDKVSISDIRNVEIEDLLERKPVRIEMERIRDYLKGKTIMVTGGGGSIGSELCRQIAQFRPKGLVVVERSESSLYDLRMELSKGFPELPLFASISSINDAAGILALMKRFEVEVVFHAAAYKHVPLMEVAPVESAYNNVLGTYNVAQAAVKAGVRRFVMISTDKAVNPANVMGVTKRIAEMVIQGLQGAGGTRFMVVRFGNVLGSAGSVIPIFKRQIQEGGPVTVTHPDIERYFMTIPEAVQLVLQAGCMGKGGEIFVLDMGSPMKIVTLAERLITLSGKRPHKDIEIRFTGLRPGEKMFEELLNRGEEHAETTHPQILVALSGSAERAFMERQIAEIRQRVLAHDEKGLMERLMDLVPGYPFQGDETERELGPGSRLCARALGGTKSWSDGVMEYRKQRV
ncbi:MAG: polysaccharide biosynthesis protein [Deltaproteobacteria bacterium]|nr:polysaccharide biosynthesis protein [Deltaproteobacteria bacterium]